MTNDEISKLSATQLVQLTTTGQLSVTKIAEAMVDKLENVNPHINAIVDYDIDQILHDARTLDASLKAGAPVGRLFGVPYTIKDLTEVKGRKYTFGLKPMKDNIGQKDAPIVTRMKNAGGLYLGKTNTPEAGYYGGTDNHLYGPTHNPWKSGYTAGGSSGGAAAAVASGLGPLAEGSDGAGSVRIPSAMCGVVGLKPSTGLIPQTILPARYAAWAYHGPITRTVADNALMLEVISGVTQKDPLTFPSSGRNFESQISKAISGLRIAWSDNLNIGNVDPEVCSIAKRALYRLAECGAKISDDTPGWECPEEAMWHAIWVAGYSVEYDMFDWDSLHGEVDDYLIDLMHEVKTLTGPQIGRAEKFRGEMWDIFSQFMTGYDLLASPTLASAAFPLTQFAPDWLLDKPLRSQLLQWLFTYPFNMLTSPAITIPAGFTASGLPVGLQLAARNHDEETIYKAASALEHLLNWPSKWPKFG